MSTSLSFVPRYHELLCGPGAPVWMPMYNPTRECVAEERQRIQAQFSRVETEESKLAPLMRRAQLRAKAEEPLGLFWTIVQTLMLTVVFNPFGLLVLIPAIKATLLLQ